MKLIYSLSTETFDPISFGTDYLYNQHERIHGFLLNNYKLKYREILAKPRLSGNIVNWYGNFDAPLSRLNEFPEDIQEKIKTEYWEVINDIKVKIDELAQSRDDERRNWAKLLNEVFNSDNNILLSDGVEWCLLWGWKFKNAQQNYQGPVFLPVTNPINNEVSSHIEPEPEKVKEPEIIEEFTPFEDVKAADEVPVETKPTDEIVDDDVLVGPIVKPTLWDIIKRFLRRFVYRWWGLLLLIVLILIISCMCKKCCANKINNSCNGINEANTKMIELENRIKERCKTR